MTELAPPVDLIVVPRAHDVGGFMVGRALPARERQMVGPFIFLDRMGPGTLEPGHGLDVRPHPHIGLSTITYLYQGQILHRDSTGVTQPIDPGEVNWMTAGRGIVHSERTADARRASGQTMSGFQSWMALPKHEEERAPGFEHQPVSALPFIQDRGVSLRLIAGTGWGQASPTTTLWPLFYADAVLAPGAVVPLDAEHEERAAFIAEGEIELAGDTHAEGRLLVFKAGDRLALRAGPRGARLLLLGGAVMDGPRHIFWNFVSSSRDRIEAAKADWQERRFPLVPGDEEEYIPLPENRKIRAESRPDSRNE
ncbi:pirin family protein [Rhodovarius crocodyli]|uniref:Pirin family protein n=1 Tax=Rhodovarius crocodyli TaxID=1979269 RepID=A0A437MEB5_9PROT|nr:pirin family protein [Rhodovarius crocodyli]RVT95939.1 pirin family protein [Rhodovarius crocodyli]